MTELKVDIENTSHRMSAARCDPVYVAVLLLVALTLLVFFPVRGYEFINFDDDLYIINNPHVNTGLTVENIRWALTSTEFSNWFPLTWISHMLDVSLFGLRPEGHHLSNLLIHTANVVVLFFVFLRLGVPLKRAAFIAALFAVHPAHVESVAWVAERKEVLSAFFWMTTILAYTRYVRNPSMANYALVVFCFILGLMSKSMIVTLPFVLLLLDYWPLGRFRPRADVRGLILEKIPLFVLCAVVSVLTVAAQKQSGAIKTLELFPIKHRLLNAFVSYVRYVVNFIAPYDLSVMYPHEKAISLMTGAGAFALIALATGFVLWRAKRFPYLFTGWFWFTGTLVPVIQIVQTGLHSMADRYTYIPYIGLFIMAAMGVPHLLKDYGKAALSLGVITILVCAGLSVKQLSYWKDSITLFTHAVSVTRDNYLAYNNLGCALSQTGRDAEAVAAFEKSFSIYPNSAVIHVNAANLMLWTNRKDDAIMHFRTAIALDPANTSAYVGIGVALLMLNKPGESIPYFEKALVLEPTLTAAVSYLNAAKHQAVSGSSTANPSGKNFN
ncbi:tetratricopeptide repeat protein [Candidatus Magnetominusculus xianensis]|uniref:Tetratricopeptide TPR_2 repeat protein n=1 Tax=Candidatus Magnetominusculus xianensis TaxID=1748249 RepID=A0ABR5SIX7_9BACT|nr:tetratricopeptide repeat protein [Candidatus Magnetominusculus xianensis]KWT92912.1 tetratricopeptide TPR_2 repeat protein [Candidatus Magnetominusculus xianensis]MBF0402916.1 tetratricopeptide repeat protein [Nitrospirota bacterium]